MAQSLVPLPPPLRQDVWRIVLRRPADQVSVGDLVTFGDKEAAEYAAFFQKEHPEYTIHATRIRNHNVHHTAHNDPVELLRADHTPWIRTVRNDSSSDGLRHLQRLHRFIMTPKPTASDVLLREWPGDEYDATTAFLATFGPAAQDDLDLLQLFPPSQPAYTTHPSIVPQPRDPATYLSYTR